MARVIWSVQARKDVEGTIAYIRQFNQVAAADIGARLFALGESLANSPHRGRPTSRGARELVTVPPYVLRYRLAGDLVVIVHVRHSRRRPLR